MSFQVPNELPPEIKNALAPLNSTKVVTDSDGNPRVVADDYLIGKGVFDPTYDYAKGDLATLDKGAGSFIDSWLVVSNPNASAAQRLAALGVMVTVVTAAAKTATFVLVFGTTIAATVPVIGAIVLAVIAVAVAVAVIMSLIFPEAEYQERSPEQKFDLRINRLPGNVPLPKKLSPPDDDAQQAMKLLGEIFMYEQQGKSRPDLRLDLANVLRGQAGLADDMYRIVADVLFDSRWQGGKVFPLYFGDPSWNRDAFQSWVDDKGNFIIPRSLPIEKFAFGTQPPINAADFREKEGEFILYVPPGTEFLPRNNQAGTPDPFPYGVGRYLLIFAVLYSLSNPKEARAATYASVYLLLIQKAWGYKAAGKEIPIGLYNSMGFLLDMLANSPVAYVSMLLNPVSGARQTSQPVFHDVDWFVKGYVDGYLLSAPKIPPTKPLEDAKPQLDSGPSTKVSTPATVLTKFPGTAPGMRARVGGSDDSALAPLQAGGYMVEFESQSPGGAGIPELFRYNGVQAAGMRQIGPGRYRIFIRTPRPFQLRNLPGLRWVISRKLST